jgi:glycosyltransferase involved in cell wall biosynthesis
MRLLYLYPEEWTGRRAREVHTLSTCAALARAGIEVALVTAGGGHELHRQAHDIAGDDVPGLDLVALSRSLGPVRSSAIFSLHFRHWLKNQRRFDRAMIIHLKAAAMVQREGIAYAWEAHEIFSETPQRTAAKQRHVATLERKVLERATRRIATSAALAGALENLYGAGDFSIVPNAGSPPLEKGVGDANGPLVYAGSIADWKGLEMAISAARQAQVPLKVIGGTETEWRALGKKCRVAGVTWHPRVPLSALPDALRGARAGLIPTLPETGSGRFSCPMKLFDYARCGLPVVTTALPALESLAIGPWCRRVEEATADAWAQVLGDFRYSTEDAEAARTWAQGHTWAERGRSLAEVLNR